MNAVLTSTFVSAVGYSEGAQFHTDKSGPEPERLTLTGPYPRSHRRFHMSTPLPCDSPQVSPGWRANDLTPADVAPILDRFRLHFTEGNPAACWEWHGYRQGGGYGSLPKSRGRANLLAHRIAWVAATGQALVDNLTIDHLCSNPPCVNPAHLEPVTMAENVRRARAAARAAAPTAEESRRLMAEASKVKYWSDPDAARARRARRKPCPECGGMYRSNGLARHVRTHGGAA